MAQICGTFKFQSEDNYAQFLEAMGAPKDMVDRVMESMPKVRNFILTVSTLHSRITVQSRLFI